MLLYALIDRSTQMPVTPITYGIAIQNDLRT